MTKVYSTIIFLVFSLVLFSVSAQAQAGYQGGEGGGYGSLAISTGTFAALPDSIKPPAFDVNVYPNPLRSNDIFKAKISGARMGEKVTFTVSDLIGTRIVVDQVEVSDEVIISIPTERLSKGIYLITFQYKNFKISRRFNFTN